MACNHPNLVITEYLSGQAKHRFKDGTHEWSDELIRIDRIVEECPDCDFRNITKQGQKLSSSLTAKIAEARQMDENKRKDLL